MARKTKADPDTATTVAPTAEGAEQQFLRRTVHQQYAARVIDRYDSGGDRFHHRLDEGATGIQLRVRGHQGAGLLLQPPGHAIKGGSKHADLVVGVHHEQRGIDIQRRAAPLAAHFRLPAGLSLQGLVEARVVGAVGQFAQRGRLEPARRAFARMSASTCRCGGTTKLEKKPVTTASSPRR